LDLHRDINHLVEVLPHSNKYLTLKAAIQVDLAYLTEDVIRAVKKALLKFFDFDNLQLGQGIHLSDIYAVIQALNGVTAARIDHLDFKNPGSPSLNVHLLIEPDYIAVLNETDLEILSNINASHSTFTFELVAFLLMCTNPLYVVIPPPFEIDLLLTLELVFFPKW
jgi:hypothetical protein